MASIYLAGKIAKQDWRADLVPFLHETWGGAWYASRWSFGDQQWPVLPSGVLGRLDYTGPYFTESCTHSEDGCGQPEHRMGSDCQGDESPLGRTTRLCLDAIDRSDIFFAWLDDATAYGTLAEIGYAHGRRKRVILATPGVPDTRFAIRCGGHGYDFSGIAELWFALAMGGSVIEAPTPAAAFNQILGPAPKFDSPIETAFWNAYLRRLPPELLGLRTQHSALNGRYRIDFALPAKKIGIELDGYAWHSSREAFTKDRERQRNLEMNGWRIIRFSGSEINANADNCVLQAATLVRGFEVAA